MDDSQLSGGRSLDQGQDPDKVYQAQIAPLGQPKNVWEANLVQWRDPESRAKLAKTAATFTKLTAADMNKGMAKATQELLEKQKLDDAVDTQLAAEDPQFRTYLDEWRKGFVRPTPFEWKGPSNMEASHLNYLKAKRDEFWRARYAEQQVTLNDPTLADQCNLGTTLGAKVAGSKGI
jgi:hypothetical protein